MAVTKMLVALMGALSVSAIPNDIAARSALIDSCLSVHNKYRQIHQAGNLEWDDNLASIASNWAAGCHGASLTHSGTGPENAYASTNLNTDDAIAAWYDEDKYYNYNNPGFSEQTGHFTQVVWLSATKVGCGWSPSQCSTNGVPMYRFFCRYDNGNMLPASNFAKNVLPANGNGGSTPQPTTTCDETTTTKAPSHQPAPTNNGPVVVYTTVTKVYGATATARPKRPHHHWKPYVYGGHIDRE